jgi:predicted alpha/beta-hydrolase family hydrolase
MSTFTVPLPDGAHTTAIAYDAQTPDPTPLLVLAHGAGADQRHRGMVAIAAGLAERGVDVVTFNFLYTEQRRRAPDRTAVLEACWRHVLAFVRPRARGPVFLGGKSMGGRIASHIAAEGIEGVRGLVLLGYPLHPPGRPNQLRDQHLPDVAAPMLFVQGSRDAFGAPAELAPVVARCRHATVHVVNEGDHSFAVPKRSGRTGEQALREVQDAVGAWVLERSRRPLE